MLFVMLGGEIISIPVARAAAGITTFDTTTPVVADHQSVSTSSLKDLLPGSNTAFADNGFVPKADKPNSVTTVYDLVAVVVDVSLDQDKNAYDGLKAQYPQYNSKLSDTELGHRVLRYAEDVRKNNDLTDVKIIFFDKNKDSVQDLASALENLYRNGDGANKNRLAGVVLVGDIPLPVVNKGGNRYISMFPYTDFSDQAYSYNPKTKSYERNASVSFPKPEIWHGVIRSPSDDFTGREQLAEYFDKNHLYYEGVEMFSKFDRRMFFGDLVHEEEQLNPDSFKQYLKYITSFEDLAYMRYNKFWAQELSSQSTEVLKDIPADIKPKVENKALQDFLSSANPLASVPDIYAKSIIDQNLIPYYQVLSKYIGSVNDFSYNTARYDKNANGSPNVDSVVGLIGIKDEYTKYYLKSVNEALEKKINEVATKIQEPLNLVDYSQLTGKIGDKDFQIEATNNGLQGTAASLFYNFNYKNEQDSKWYINGTDAAVIDSPKQCFPLLGSTKSSYFDKNLAFNPKAVGGKYSVLTRSLRSDNGATATDLHTAGVYTRMLSPVSIGVKDSELFTATGGAYAGQANSDGTYDTGAVIEDNPAYGISAFIHNPLAGKGANYKGPIEQAFQKGDVIVKVNGQNLNYSYSFDQAIENSYQAVKYVIDTINDNKNVPSQQLKNFPYQVKVIPNESVDDGDAAAVVGYFSVDFYRAGKPAKQYFSFTVNKDGLTTNTDPQGKPEAYVLLDTPTGLDFNNPDFYNANSQGAIFTLYHNKGDGYNYGAYDDSAGCNANSTNKNSDRCLGMVASMPVLDPAGSLAPVLMSIPGLGDRLKFPEKVKRNNLGQNSGNKNDYTTHVDSYQFPGGLQTDYHKYDDVDQVYFNSCYTGLPSVTDISTDSNPYKFVLDSSTSDGSSFNIEPDFYGQLMKQFETFISSSKARQNDYETDNGTAENSTFNPKTSIWAGRDKVDASEIILNSNPKITLKDFADNYGLFDGVDNDGNGLTDYEWKDSDGDGIYDSKYYDFKEDDTKYAIPSWDTQEIARKLLSHDGSYTIPYSVSSFPNKKAGVDKDVTLVVKADSVKKLPSLILHNEPTDYTISQQMKSQTAFSLPIDNPRYVAFQTAPSKGPSYPADKNQPNKPNLDVQAIINSLGDTNPPVYPGQIQKVKYVNLFDPNITNMAQLQSAIITKATELAAVPGSYRIIDPNAAPDKYTPKEITDAILNNYLSPVVNNNDIDSPASGFNLEKGSSKKIYDALSWLKMNIDEKHQYILQYYLNGDANNQGNAYVADHTLLPSPAGTQAAFGYEAAYLVLNGNKSSFDMNFNKAVPEEKDNVFDPLAQFQGNAGNGGGNGGQGAGDGAGDQSGVGKAGDEFEFVWVQDFLKEMQKFIKSLTTVPEFTNECFSPESWNPGSKDKLPVGPAKTGDGSIPEGQKKNVPDANANQVQLSSYVYHEIAGYDDLLKKIEDQNNAAATSTENGNGTSNTGGNNSSGGDYNTGNTSSGGTSADGTQSTGLQQILDNIGQNAGVSNGGNKTTRVSPNKAGTNSNGNTNKTDGSGNNSGTTDSSNKGTGTTDTSLTGNGSAGTSDLGKNTATGDSTTDSTQKEKDLIILKSTLIQDTAPVSRDIKTKPVETPAKTVDTQKIEAPVETQKAPEIKPEPNQKWEEYFIGAKYYQKFIPKGPQTSVRRLFAEVLSDNPFITATKDQSSKFLVESNDSMVADNSSLMKIEATIFDSKGNAEINGSHKVKFSISSDLVIFKGSNTVESKGGIATVYLKAGKVTGDFYIKEEVLKDNGKVDTGYQVVTKDLHLVAGEPANVDIQSDSGVLVANNQSKMVLNIVLKDKFGNVANNSFEKIGVFVNDKAKFDPKSDSDNKLIGTQLDTLDGKASAELFAGGKSGSADVVAVVMDQDLQDQLLAAGNDISGIDFKKHVGATKSFQVLDKVDLSLQLFDENFQAITELPADGKSIARLGVKLLNNGQTVKAFNGPVKFTVLKINLGNFVSKPPSNLVNGELNAANITFKVGTVTGQEEILIDIPGFASDSFKFKIKSNKATQILLSGSEDIIDSSSNKQVTLTAKVLDTNGNFVDSDNGTVISFLASKATSDLVNFSQNKAVTKDGVATVQISGKNISGTANLLAQSTGLNDGIISLKINKHVTSDIVKNFSPRALYVSLLGGAYGQVGDQNNLANSILFSKGQVEAISAVTATQSEKKRMFAVDGYGKIDFLTSTVYGKVINATNSFPYQKVLLSDDIAGDDLANVFVVPKTDSPVLLVDDKTNIPDKDGVFVKILDEANKSMFSQDSDGIYVKVGSDTKMKVDKYGRIYLNDEVYKLRVPTKDEQIDVSNFAFILSKGGSDIALISIKQNFGKGVQTMNIGDSLQNLTPGVYVEPVSIKNKYSFVTSYTGDSTAEPQGIYLVDDEEDIDPNQAPGFGYGSLDGVKKEFGLGFQGSNKHMLLFAAGNSVGASFVPYASDSGIIYGDPTIKLKVSGDLVSKDTGYSKDIGKPIFSGQEPIKQMIEFDANGDGYDDLLLVYESGLIRLMENEISNKRFRDRGYILNIYGGIESIAKIDVDNDGYDDLVVGTKQPCNAGEQCVSLIKNTNGNFDRKPLNLALQDKKVYEMKVADMNNDGCEDLVTSDSSGSISIFYNKSDGKSCQGLDTNYGYSKNFGFTLNSDLNEIANIFLNYPGMEKPDSGKDIADANGNLVSKSNWYKFIQFSLPTTQPPAVNAQEKDPAFSSAQYAQDATELQSTILDSNNISTKDVPQQTYDKNYDFIHIAEDGNFKGKSVKEAKDLNGGSVANGDIIEYLIALQNDGDSEINNLMLSDATPTSMTLVQSSLKCLDAGCPDKLEWLDTGTSMRSSVIKNVSVPAHGKRIISYQMTVNFTPKVHFDIGNNFVKYPSNANDPYQDIMIRPEVNPDGIISYLYSTGPKTYEKFDVNPANNSNNALDDAFKKIGLPSPTELLKDANGQLSADTKAALQKFSNSQNTDKDYNGCADKWNNVLTNAEGTGEAVATGIGNILGAMRCSGAGCLPIPYNIALLTPGAMGEGTPGFPTFLAGTPNPPFFGFFLPSYTPSSFRLYLSPTLTMGLGTAVCGGPSATGICFAFAVPGGIPGVCSAIKASVNKAVSFAKSATVAVTGQSAIITDGEGTGGTKGVNMGGNFGSDSPLAGGAKVNIKIPGFPSVITNWMDGETDEIYSKLLRFPTFYFILPDFSKIAQESKLAGKEFSFASFHDFASSLSNFPFVKLEGKEIVIKVPAISPKEIAKYKIQADAWVKHMENELQKYNAWNCAANENRKTICDKIVVNMQNLMASVKRTMDLLDKLTNLPKDILQFKTIQARYATQIICYLDAIMNYTGGYIKRQQKIIQSWIKTIQDVIKTFKQWKLILDLSIDYQQSCDKCKSDRFGKLGLLMQLFVALPDIPIVPLPKWPDIVVDFSQIKTGIKIVWPDVVFRPEPIILPNLPDITLPDVIPDLAIDIPGFNVNLPDLSKFSLPTLPDLPQIPLPQLPDLPRPPKIPGLPNIVGKLMVSLKTIFKILCLLKNGFIPIPESTLSTEIATLTQPSVDAILPLIKNLGMQFPPIQYSYVDQIRITGKISFDIDTNLIYVAADKGAQIWNDGMSNLVKGINRIMSIPFGQIINTVIQDAINKAAKQAQDSVDQGTSTVKGAVDSTTSSIKNKSSSLPLSFDTTELDSFKKEMDDYIATVKKEDTTPDVYHLIATEHFIDSTDPILNRTLADVKDGIKFEDLPNSGNLKQLAEIRNQMIASVDSLNSSNDVLGDISDYNEFNKILVDNNNQHIDLIAANPTVSDVGRSNISDNVSGKTLSFSFLGKDIEDTLNQAASTAGLSEKRDLIASAIDFTPQTAVSGANEPTIPPAGFFVSAGGVDESVLNFTGELNGSTNIVFSDVDHDKDTDIVYSMGGDVYLKTNYQNTPNLPKGDLIVGFTKNAVSDYVNAGGDGVKGVQVPYIGTGKIDISWQPTEDAVSYEVVLRKSIYDDFKDAAYTFKINVTDLSDKTSPRISEKIPNGNYYVSVFAVNATGNKSLESDVIIAAPQSCADSDAPMPVLNSTDYTLSIFKNLEIDSSGSFDPDGEIKQYYLETIPFETDKTDPITKEKLKTTPIQKTIWSDLTAMVDEDGNGLTFDDRTNPKFNIGPFSNEGDVGDHKFLLHVVDASGKDASLQFVVHVVAPNVSLDQSFATTAVATGKTLPVTAQLPFWLMRSRYIQRIIKGKLTLVPRIDKVRESTTGDDGAYNISDFNLEDMILVENADGKIVAEINPKTGDLGKIEPGYKTIVNEAIPPNTPTSVTILDKNNQVLGTVYIIGNANSDVNIYQNYNFNSANIEFIHGTNVDDLDKADNFVFENLPANDADNPGGVVLKNTVENKIMVSIDSTGNIVVLDKRITLTQKPNDHTKEPLIIQINFEGKVIGEVYISLVDPAVVLGPNDVPFMSPRKPSEGVLNGSQALSSKPNIANLVFDPGFKFTQQDLVKRKDFVKVLLAMICVIPRPESHEPFKAGTGYADNNILADYHPYIKEATLLGFVDGYKGEPDSQGLFPFKSENNISRAEAVKIILKALQYRNIVDVSGLKEGDPWFGDYMKAAQDLTPYLKGGKPLQNNFIVTPEEAKDPYKLMTFGELLIMVQRVLDTYNCFEVDSNNNGLTDYCEEKYHVTDPSADPDKDGLNSALECADNLNPLDPDTDGGGVTDGKEIAAHTNPLDPTDDAIDDDNDGLSNYDEVNIYHTDPHNPDTDGGGKSDGKEVADCGNPLDPTDDKNPSACKNQSVPGLYIVPAECNTCPCISTFLHKAELIPGDIFFSVVGTYYSQYYDSKPNDKTYIFTKGNEVQIQSINK